jgi:DNA-binding CsgD family transcriptional regulator
LSLRYSTLTPREIQIAYLVKEGKSSREMAELLNVSMRTIESHRQKIRMKIGIKNGKANLRSQLMSME